MPNRIIKDSLLTSAQYAALGLFERDLFIRLIVAADDYGRYDARPAVVQGRLMPLEEGVTRQQVARGLRGLERAGLIILYEHGGAPYLYLTGWERHQTIRAKRSKYPAPGEGIGEPAKNDGGTMQADAPHTSCGPPQAPPEWYIPTQEEVKDYCLREGMASEKSRSLVSFLTRRPARNWQSIGRVWLRNDRSRGAGSAETGGGGSLKGEE